MYHSKTQTRTSEERKKRQLTHYGAKLLICLSLMMRVYDLQRMFSSFPVYPIFSRFHLISQWLCNVVLIYGGVGLTRKMSWKISLFGKILFCFLLISHFNLFLFPVQFSFHISLNLSQILNASLSQCALFFNKHMKLIKDTTQPTVHKTHHVISMEFIPPHAIKTMISSLFTAICRELARQSEATFRTN